MNSATLAIGNGYPVEQCTRGDGGCWQEPRWRLGYDCVGGIRFRYYFMLIVWMDIAGRHGAHLATWPAAAGS